jgi:2-methylcitrate dehydratase PrpD
MNCNFVPYIRSEESVMSTAIRSVSNTVLEAHEPLATRLARATQSAQARDPGAEVTAKVKLCLMDVIGCAFESRDLPWSRQAVAVAESLGDKGGATIIGFPAQATYGDAAFANAVMGHGLVREDMHSGSISHLGIVVLPTLLALSQYQRVSGRDFISAATVGYEVGGQIGRALMDAEIARIHRPTGVTGPVAASAAGARLLGLGIEETTHAIAMGANTTLGFNQWAHTGGSEMFFHPGFAARNAVTSVRLAENGAFVSPSALDGEAGLFASLRKRSAASKVEMFRGEPEILAVYHKPVPACNFAQTPAQAALTIAREKKWPAEKIAAITIRVTRAGALYPGCDYTGPFAHILQAKMSIQYNVAAALLEGGVTEKNFTLLHDARLHRLIGLMGLEIDDALTQAYPALQGGEVEVRLTDGSKHRVRLDNVVNASASDVRTRFLASTTDVLGRERALAIESCIESLDRSDDAGQLAALLRA